MAAPVLLSVVAALTVARFAAAATGSLLRQQRGEADVQANVSALPVSYVPTVVRTMEHPSKPFTQGLEFSPDETILIETSGAFPAGVPSFIRKVDPMTGRTIGSVITDGLVTPDGNSLFVEGISYMQGKWYASTYNEHRIASYDSELSFLQWQKYPWEGWGLAPNQKGSGFFATNSSVWIQDLHPDSFQVTREMKATCMGKAIPAINELEMVHNFLGTGQDVLFGNVYTTRLVVGLDPNTGNCVAVLDLTGLGDVHQDEASGYHVANGIAYRRSNGNFIVTGKNWDKMFEVSLAQDPRHDAAGALSSYLARASPSPR